MVIIYYNYLFKKKFQLKIKNWLLIIIFWTNGLTFISQNNNSLVKFVDYPKVKAYKAKKSKNSSMFQGNKKTKKYFEGWYFKMVSQDEMSILSVIPGISISEDGTTKHAFIQIIDGKNAKTEYISYPIEEFYYSKDDFLVQIGNNFFSKDSLILDISKNGIYAKGKVYMKNMVALVPNGSNRPKKIMGWYDKVPFMQCYHGVVSLNHDLEGEIKVNKNTYTFHRGKGYIEKDWGKSMPSSWIWIQSNNFKNSNSSFMLSIAKIPWMGFSFTGFLGFYYVDDKIVRFGTYSKAKFKVSKMQEDSLSLKIYLKNEIIEINTNKRNSGLLKAPVKGSMDRRISESIDAKLSITITNNKNNSKFKDVSSITGLETVGEKEDLFNKKHLKK